MSRVRERLLLWVADVLDRSLFTVPDIDELGTYLVDSPPLPLSPEGPDPITGWPLRPPVS